VASVPRLGRRALRGTAVALSAVIFWAVLSAGVGGAVGIPASVRPPDAGSASVRGGRGAGSGVPDPPSVTADAAVLMDWRTGCVLFAKNAYRRRPPASTTKILTAVVILENARLSERVKVSRNAAWTPGSSMPLREGQVLTLGELLWGILLRSANNGCVAAAEHIAGSERAFVEMMNRRAAELGACGTHFQNSSGLHAPSHYTTAYDLAVIARYALTIPAFEAIVRTRQASLYVDGSEAEMRLRNTNSLLWTFTGAEGVKTGTTDQAGKCLVASATRDGRRLISVVLRSADRYRDTEVLLEWGFRNYETVCLARARRPLATAPVTGGLVGKVALVPEQDLWVVCPAGMSEDLELEVDLARPLRAPVRKGQVVGVAEGVMGDETVQAVNLLAAGDVPLWTPERAFLRLFLRLFRFLAAHGIG